MTIIEYWRETGFQEQYKFIYDTLEEYCRGIDSRFPVSELANQIKEKTLKDKKLKKNAYALEYTVKKKKQKNPLILFFDPCFTFPTRSLSAGCVDCGNHIYSEPANKIK
jgi:hypothetical protein